MPEPHPDAEGVGTAGARGAGLGHRPGSRPGLPDLAPGAGRAGPGRGRGRAASATASSRLGSKLAGRCHHRPFRFKVFPPNERWLTVYGDPNY
jgi:hypothetical protein